MSPSSRPEVVSQDDTVSRSKRTLMKAGWVAPVVLVLSLPVVSFDANASGGRPPCGGPPGPPAWVPACNK